MTKVQILTSDTEWAARRGTPGPEGRTIVEVATVEARHFAGREWLRFDLGDDLPGDWTNRWTMTPAEWAAA